MSENFSAFSRLILLDSIPGNELNTAANLREALVALTARLSHTFTVEYERIESASELLDFLARCRDEVAGGGRVPMLHIECHGDTDGLQLADSSLIDWPDLKAPITELNIATKLNLMIGVAACVGGAMAKIVSMGDRAPFWGLIGPTKNMSPEALEDGFTALYGTMLDTQSPEQAIQKMRDTSSAGTYMMTTAQGLFEKGWKAYQEQHTTYEALELRANRMLERYKAARPAPYPSTEEFKRRLLGLEPQAYARYISTFFMHDLFPENIKRFHLKAQQL